MARVRIASGGFASATQKIDISVTLSENFGLAGSDCTKTDTPAPTESGRAVAPPTDFADRPHPASLHNTGYSCVSRQAPCELRATRHQLVAQTSPSAKGERQSTPRRTGQQTLRKTPCNGRAPERMAFAPIGIIAAHQPPIRCDMERYLAFCFAGRTGAMRRATHDHPTGNALAYPAWVGVVGHKLSAAATQSDGDNENSSPRRLT